MDERFRHEDQDAFCPPRQDEPVENEARFDCFSQPDFIGEQNPRRQTPGDFGSDVELMRNQIDSSACEAAHPGLALAVLMFKCGEPEVEHLRWIELACEQTFLGLVEADRIAQLRLAQIAPMATIEQQPVPLGDGLDDQ